MAYSDVFSKDDFPEELRFDIPVPTLATEYAVFLKITECVNGEPKNWPHTTGMRCVAVGNIEGKQKKKANGAIAAKDRKPIQEKSRRKTPQKGKKKGS